MGTEGPKFSVKLQGSTDNSLDINSSTVDSTCTYAMVFNLANLANPAQHMCQVQVGHCTGTQTDTFGRELSKKKAIVAKLCMSKPVDCIKVKAPVV